jgi:SAM-dependent methyltransferase
MDEPCSHEDFRGCLVDMARVSRYWLGYRPTLCWLEQFKPTRNRPLRVVDVGCGGGDMLRRIESWARSRHLPVRLTGVDITPYAERTARELSPAGSAIEWRAGDLFSVCANDQIDVVISWAFHPSSHPTRARPISHVDGS